MSYRAGGTPFRTVGPSYGDGARASSTAGLGQLSTPAQMKKYWDGMARACTQMADEGACLARVARHVPVTFQMAGLGQTGGAPLGMPAASFRTDSDARYWQIDAHWVQRAINAWRAQNASRGALILVDGQSGPITLAALNAISPGLPAAANVPPTARVSGWVAVSKTLAQQLAALPAVSDPSRPSSSTTTSTTLARSTSTSPSTGSKPGAASTDTSAVVGVDPNGQAVLVDEGSSTQPAWLIPALIAGGVVIAGGVGYMIWKRRTPAPRTTTVSTSPSRASRTMARPSTRMTRRMARNRGKRRNKR